MADDDETAIFLCAPCETRFLGPKPRPERMQADYPPCWLCHRRATERVFSMFFTHETLHDGHGPAY